MSHPRSKYSLLGLLLASSFFLVTSAPVAHPSAPSTPTHTALTSRTNRISQIQTGATSSAVAARCIPDQCERVEIPVPTTSTVEMEKRKFHSTTSNAATQGAAARSHRKVIMIIALVLGSLILVFGIVGIVLKCMSGIGN